MFGVLGGQKDPATPPKGKQQQKSPHMKDKLANLLWDSDSSAAATPAKQQTHGAEGSASPAAGMATNFVALAHTPPASRVSKSFTGVTGARLRAGLVSASPPSVTRNATQVSSSAEKGGRQGLVDDAIARGAVGTRRRLAAAPPPFSPGLSRSSSGISDGTRTRAARQSKGELDFQVERSFGSDFLQRLTTPTPSCSWQDSLRNNSPTPRSRRPSLSPFPFLTRSPQKYGQPSTPRRNSACQNAEGNTPQARRRLSSMSCPGGDAPNQLRSTNVSASNTPRSSRAQRIAMNISNSNTPTKPTQHPTDTIHMGASTTATHNTNTDTDTNISTQHTNTHVDNTAAPPPTEPISMLQTTPHLPPHTTHKSVSPPAQPISMLQPTPQLPAPVTSAMHGFDTQVQSGLACVAAPKAAEAIKAESPVCASPPLKDVCASPPVKDVCASPPLKDQQKCVPEQPSHTSPQSEVGSCNKAPPSDGYLTSPGSCTYAASPPLPKRQQHQPMPLHDFSSPDTAGHSVMHGGGLQGYEDPADLRRSASQDPDHLFANPMFMDRYDCSSPAGQPPRPHTTNRLFSTPPHAQARPMDKSASRASSGLSTPCPEGHSEPSYTHSAADSPPSHHSEFVVKEGIEGLVQMERNKAETVPMKTAWLKKQATTSAGSHHSSASLASASSAWAAKAAAQSNSSSSGSGTAGTDTPPRQSNLCGLQAALSPSDVAAAGTPRGLISSLQGSVSLAASRASHGTSGESGAVQSDAEGPLPQEPKQQEQQQQHPLPPAAPVDNNKAVGSMQGHHALPVPTHVGFVSPLIRGLDASLLGLQGKAGGHGGAKRRVSKAQRRQRAKQAEGSSGSEWDSVSGSSEQGAEEEGSGSVSLRGSCSQADSSGSRAVEQQGGVESKQLGSMTAGHVKPSSSTNTAGSSSKSGGLRLPASAGVSRSSAHTEVAAAGLSDCTPRHSIRSLICSSEGAGVQSGQPAEKENVTVPVTDTAADLAVPASSGSQNLWAALGETGGSNSPEACTVPSPALPLEQLLCGSSDSPAPTPRQLIQGLLGPAPEQSSRVEGGAAAEAQEVQGVCEQVADDNANASTPDSKACVRTLSWGQDEGEAAECSKSPSQPAAEEERPAATLAAADTAAVEEEKPAALVESSSATEQPALEISTPGAAGSAAFGSCIGSLNVSACEPGTPDCLNAVATSSLIPLAESSTEGVGESSQEGGEKESSRERDVEGDEKAVDEGQAGGLESWQGQIQPSTQQVAHSAEKISEAKEVSHSSDHCQQPAHSSGSVRSDADRAGDQASKQQQRGSEADSGSKDGGQKQQQACSDSVSDVSGDQKGRNAFVSTQAAAAKQTAVKPSHTASATNITAAHIKVSHKLERTPPSTPAKSTLSTPATSTSNTTKALTQKQARAARRASIASASKGSRVGGEQAEGVLKASISRKAWQETSVGRWLAALLVACLGVLLLASFVGMLRGITLPSFRQPAPAIKARPALNTSSHSMASNPLTAPQPTSQLAKPITPKPAPTSLAAPVLQLSLLHAIQDPAVQLPLLCFDGVDADALVGSMTQQELRFQQAWWNKMQRQNARAREDSSKQAGEEIDTAAGIEAEASSVAADTDLSTPDLLGTAEPLATLAAQLSAKASALTATLSISSNSYRWLSIPLVACLVATVTAAACMLAEAGNQISSTRLLPSLHHTSHTAWHAAQVLGMASAMLYTAASDRASAFLTVLATSHTRHWLQFQAQRAAHVLQSLTPLLTRATSAALSLAQACVQQARTALSSISASDLQSWVTSVIFHARTSMRASVPYAKTAVRVGVAAYHAARPLLLEAGKSCVEHGWEWGCMFVEAVSQLVRGSGQFATAMRPHLSSAADVLLQSAAAAVVAMGMGEAAPEADGEAVGEGEEQGREGAGAVHAAGSSGRVLHLKPGAPTGPSLLLAHATPAGGSSRRRRSLFARRTPSRFLEDEEAERVLRQQQQEAAIQAAAREELLGRVASAAEDDLLGSASTEHFWLRGRLVLRQTPQSVDRQQRRQE